MSGQDQAESIVDTTKSLKRKNLSEEDQDCLNELDRAFKRIKTVVPPVPYILSAPSLHPYRYHSQQEANAWMMGRLWRHNEEHLQYRTYMYREPCQDCLELQAGEDEPEPERPGSRASNTGDPPKKKLNLSAFKVKQVNGTNTPNSKKPSPNLPPTKPVHEQVNGIKKLEKSAPPKPETDLKSSSKISSNEPRENSKPAKPHRDNPRTDVKPQATATQSQKQESAETKHIVDKSSQSNTTPHGLPPLLSPVHEPPSNPYGLPDILSPTLPSNIQAELDRLEVQRKRAESNASTSSSDRKSQALSVPSTKPAEPAEPAKSDTRIRSVSTNGQPPVLAKPRSTATGNSSLVVKLKFSKAKIPIVRQILKLPPKRTPVEKKDRQEPTKEAPASSQAKEDELKKPKPVPKIAARRSENTTPVPSSTAKPSASSTATKVAEKRPRVDDDLASAVPAKRARAASTLDRPVTPMQHGTSSPALSNKSSAQKAQGQYLTPKNTQKATSMLRTQSTESNDSTPGQSVPTPTGMKAEAKPGPTSAPSSKKQVDITLLAQASMKLNQMGRALKHEATKILTGAGKQITKQDEKLAAVTNMECILSYMAAYHAQDLSVVHRGRAPEVESTWKTLLPLCLSYARTTKEFKHLDGLRSYLSSVIASTICSHVSQRISTSQPHDSPQDVSRADLAKQHAALTANFALLSDHNMKANQHFQKARVALPFEDIQTMYKKTYAAREANAKLAKEPEKIAGARMSGPYFLPLAHDTTAIQAARFGLRFLAEYCEKEKLDYAFRVKLDKAD